MVRKVTTTEKIKAQWAAAWAMLTDAQRVAVWVFLRDVDRDIGGAIIGAD